MEEKGQQLGGEGLFLRQATGLVRSWSVYDVFAYVGGTMNPLVFLFIAASAVFWPDGNIITGSILSGVLVFFMIIVYAGLITTLPRSGGDYTWLSRIFGGAWGFIIAFPAWIFILWQWVPIHAQILAQFVISTVLVVLSYEFGGNGWIQAANWINGPHGIFLTSIISIVFVCCYIGFGMRTYARVQRITFSVGLLGLISAIIGMLLMSRGAFVDGLNTAMSQLYGTSNAYEAIMAAGQKGGTTPVTPGTPAILGSLALIPLLLFWCLWPNWGATLAGELRGANDFRRNIWGMLSALIWTVVTAVVLTVLFARMMGWDFYNDTYLAYYGGNSPLPLFPYPLMLYALAAGNTVWGLWILISFGMFFWAWSGSVFLSSTRVIFAAAFDRLLPEFMADVSPRFRSPNNALLAMAIPSVFVSALYAYTGFSRFTLDATVVIAVSFWATVLAGVLLPWLKLIRGVTERMDEFGTEVIPVYDHEVVIATKELIDQGVEAICICCLFSYVNDAHEKHIGHIVEQVLAEHGMETPIYYSCEIRPVIRDQSRLNSVIIEAYAAARGREQLMAVEEAAQRQGYRHGVQTVLSYGGLTSIRYPRLHETMISGPVGASWEQGTWVSVSGLVRSW